MGLLASKYYDPATVTNAFATNVLAVMTAIDTTNLRATFTVPSSGNVLVRIRAVGSGGSATPCLFFGVLNGSTVVARHAPQHSTSSSTTSFVTYESEFVVTGLTPGASLTWDAACGVERVAASSALKVGGADDGITTTAYGALIFEVWSA